MDYTTAPFEEAVEDVDVVIDLVGDAHDQTSTRSLDVLRPGGLLIAIPGGVSPELRTAAEARGVRSTALAVEPDGPALVQIARLIDTGEVTVEVAGTFPLEQVADAHAQGETRHTRGKLVLSQKPRADC